ncbi:MAG: hypothetical protein WB987_12405 [Candidatus Acidiferrales bacterium]
METVNPNKAGIVLGTLTGGWHFLWAILVAAGWAQWVLDFVFWMHFLKPPYVVGPFHLSIALVLILVTTSAGYAVGYILGLLWNWIHR